MISRNTHGQHNQHHGYSCAAQASLPVRVGQFFERPSPSRHQCQLHSGRDPMTPRPHGRATWRGPHGPGQLRPNFRCLFIRKERCGWLMLSFIPTRRLLYVSRINYKSHIPVWTSRQDIILFFILTLRALYVTPLPLDRYTIVRICLDAQSQMIAQKM